jgi:hypothetical protein
MNEMMKTVAIAGGAVALAILASTMGPKEIKNDLFSDQGQLFFPQFNDPNAAVDLEVTQFLEGQAEAVKFAVRRDAEGRWTIPSHGNYPADAKDRMGKAAALLIGLKKDQCVGERKEDEVAYGVVDPLDGGADTKGRGTRVTMKDSAGNVLADLIVGKEVEKKMQVRYLRAPGKKRVYAAKLDGEVSTKFADWIETDLLKAQSFDIAKVTMDNYSVDETNGTIKKGDVYVATKDDAGKWAFDGVDPAKEEANEDKLREVGDTLGQIKIVGVRKKPEGLTAMLEQASGFDRQILRQTLAEKGYFVANNGKLVSNEGDLLFETKKGVRYTLRFGELVPGSGLDVTSGADDPKSKPKDGEAPKPGDNRYLMVTAEFAEAILQKPAGVRLAQDQLDKRATARRDVEDIQKAVEAFRAKNANKLPESLAKLAEKPAEGAALLAELKKDPWGNDYILSAAGDSYVVISYADGNAEGGEAAATDLRSDRLPLEDELKKAADEWTEFDRKVDEGKKEAEKLTKRFGGWYYVIDGALFQKLKPKREDLVKAKAAEAAPATAPTTGNEPPK